MGIDSVERRICDVIAKRDAEMRADLARWVGIPTGHNYVPGLDEQRGVIVDRLCRLGARAELIPGDPRPEWIGDGGSGGPIPPAAVVRGLQANGPRLLISGHLDTVFHRDEAFRSLTIDSSGQRAIGPGCVDMKGGLLIACIALETLAEAGIHASWTVILNSDEETGSYHSDTALRAEAKKHDIGLALEPGVTPPAGSNSWGLATARKGSGQFFIETHGRAAHAGRDFEKGVSAVYALGRVITALEGMVDLRRGLTVNVGPISGGKATNVVPDHASLSGNVRYPDPAIGDAFRAQLDRLATSPDAMPRVSVKHSFNRPAKPLIPATQQLAERIRDTATDLGQSLSFIQTGGVCDGNNLQAAGLPTIDTLGVRGGGLHTHQEWIDLTSLVERAQLLAIVLKRLSAQVG